MERARARSTISTLTAAQLEGLLNSLSTLAAAATPAAANGTASSAGAATAPELGSAGHFRDELRHIDKPQRLDCNNFEAEQEQWDDWEHIILNCGGALDERYGVEL